MGQGSTFTFSVPLAAPCVVLMCDSNCHRNRHDSSALSLVLASVDAETDSLMAEDLTALSGCCGDTICCFAPLPAAGTWCWPPMPASASGVSPTRPSAGRSEPESSRPAAALAHTGNPGTLESAPLFG